MSVMKPSEIAAYLKEKKNPLVVSGYLCDTMKLDGAPLVDYAALLAKKLDAPIAATANTAKLVKERGVERSKKMWLGELLNYMRDPWLKQYMQRDVPRLESLQEQRPDVLVLIGYNSRVADWFISGLKNVDTVALSPTAAMRATCTLSDSDSIGQWKSKLEGLMAAL